MLINFQKEIVQSKNLLVKIIPAMETRALICCFKRAIVFSAWFCLSVNAFILKILLCKLLLKTGTSLFINFCYFPKKKYNQHQHVYTVQFPKIMMERL